MAIVITKTTIHDGPVNLVVHCVLDGDTEFSEDLLRGFQFVMRAR